MKVKASVAILNEGFQEPKENEIPADKSVEVIEEWVTWFRTQLKEAVAKGQDVEILLGRKPAGHEFPVEQSTIDNNMYI